MTDHDQHFQQVDDSPPLDGMIGSSSSIKRVFQLTRVFAASDAAVLLQGETGTGKQQIAAAIHQLSSRSEQAYQTVNCGTLSESQFDSSVSAAQSGTLFLDEVDALSLPLQIKLLRLLQEKSFQPAGATDSQSVDVRVVAASNCDLNKVVIENRFREDLYWRLNVLPIDVPPVRRRSEDIEDLVRYFLQKYSKANRKTIDRIQPDAMTALVEYSFPGNVRELENYLERAVVLCQSDVITTAQLPPAVVGNSKDAQVAVFRPTDDESLIREFVYSQISKSDDGETDLFKRIVDPVEKELLIQVLDLCNQTQTKAAKKLGINRNTLYQKLVKFGLAKPKANVKES